MSRRDAQCSFRVCSRSGLDRGGKVLAILLACVYVGLSSGCWPVGPGKMTVMSFDHAEINEELKGAIRVRGVTGGRKADPIWRTRVDGETVALALEFSLANRGYLAENGTTGDYWISADVKELKQPIFGPDLEVRSFVVYRVTGPGTDQEFPIRAVGTSYLLDSILTPERIRIANERSIQSNIRALLMELDRLSVPAR